jgi:hypothetical protein
MPLNNTVRFTGGASVPLSTSKVSKGVGTLIYCTPLAYSPIHTARDAGRDKRSVPGKASIVYQFSASSSKWAWGWMQAGQRSGASSPSCR